MLAGERARYELARGNRTEAERLLHVIEAQTNEGGFIPEQIWEADDIPERELWNGKPSGSAMPLIWAHAEYMKLLRSLKDGRVFDMPPQTAKRYLENNVVARYSIWRFNQRSTSIPAGYSLRIEVLEPAVVVWTSDGWLSQQETETVPTPLNTFFLDIPTTNLNAGSSIIFTFRWAQGHWEGTNFQVTLV